MNNSLQVLLITKALAEGRAIEDLLSRNTIKKVDVMVTSSMEDLRHHLARRPIEVILLGLLMSDDQDFEFFKKIYRLAGHIPIIVISKPQAEAITMSFIKEGAQDVFVKGTFDGNMLVRSMGFSIERKRHEERLNEYSVIFEHANDAVFSLTMDDKIKSWNPAAEVIYKYVPEEMIGQPFSLLVPLQQATEMARVLANVKSGGASAAIEIVLLDKQGNNVYSVLHVSPIQHNFGVVIGVVIQAQDLTNQKLSVLQSSLQLRVATILSESIDLTKATQGVLKVICETLGFVEGEIWVLDAHVDVLRYVGNWSVDNTYDKLVNDSQHMVFHIHEGLPGYIWASKKVYWTNTLNQDGISTRRALLVDLKLNSCFGFPIQFADQVFGVFLFFGAHKKQFDLSFMIIFEIIGKQIGGFFKHRRMEDELLHIAQYDVLTGLANKFYMEKTLSALIAQAKKLGTKVAFLYFDLDDFKHINDSLGHSTGDVLLQEIAHRVKKIMREGDVFARFGGDEYALALAGIGDHDEIDTVAKKILAIIERPVLFGQKEYYLTASMGISIFPDNGDTFEVLFKAADLCMYNAKKSGKNTYRYATPILETIEQDELMLSNMLYRAVQKNEFILYYQPIVDIKTKDIISLEALIRWKLPSGEIACPDSFIPQLEASNMILKTGLWVLDTACHQMQKWQKNGMYSVSINMSARQLNVQLIEVIKTILHETGLSPDKLILEITESMLMHQTYIAIDVLSDLKALGVHVAIDDFGTGYSSFAYLKNFEMQLLKIDKSFIAGLPNSETSKSIVKAIILMAHALGLKVIAEGVETTEQLEFLRTHQCDMYQGYYFCKPLPPEELEQQCFG